MTTYQQAVVDGSKIFYREDGPKDRPTILLLHGFPTSRGAHGPVRKAQQSALRVPSCLCSRAQTCRRRLGHTGGSPLLPCRRRYSPQRQLGLLCA
jgi:pimeloyl-ACP methyl ester carboxylesterase